MKTQYTITVDELVTFASKNGLIVSRWPELLGKTTISKLVYSTGNDFPPMVVLEEKE